MKKRFVVGRNTWLKSMQALASLLWNAPWELLCRVATPFVAIGCGLLALVLGALLWTIVFFSSVIAGLTGYLKEEK
jgi:hypothetical protein